MKKHAAGLLILMLVALTGLGIAQTRTMIEVQVPFDFVVNGKTMPAGECTIKVEGNGPHMLWITTGDKHAYVLPIATESRDASSETILAFHRYGDRYFLAKINLEGSSGGYEFPASKVEAELRARNTTEKIVTLLASAK